MTTRCWTFTGGPPSGTDADWVKQEAGTDRRCFDTTHERENVLLQAKVCQSGNGEPDGERAGRRHAEHTGAVTAGAFGYTSPTSHTKNHGTLSVRSGRWNGSDRSYPEGMADMAFTITSEVGEAHPVEGRDGRAGRQTAPRSTSATTA